MTTGPFKCVNAVVKINGNTVGCIEGFEPSIEHEGGIEMFYGSLTGRHAIGGKSGSFTARRWFQSDDDTDLFYDLMNEKIPFTLSGEISGLANSQLLLSNCIAYSYKPRYGAANDVIGEEISGKAIDWSATI